MLFMRFMTCLALGLFGLCIVLVTVFESVLADWDILGDLRLIIEDPRHMREALRRKHAGLEGAAQGVPAPLATRLDPYRREERQADAVLN